MWKNGGSSEKIKLPSPQLQFRIDYIKQTQRKSP